MEERDKVGKGEGQRTNGKRNGSHSEQGPRQQGPSTGQYLDGEAGCPVDPVLIPGAVPARVLAELDGVAFKERGHPRSRLRHLGGGW